MTLACHDASCASYTLNHLANTRMHMCWRRGECLGLLYRKVVTATPCTSYVGPRGQHSFNLHHCSHQLQYVKCYSTVPSCLDSQLVKPA